VLDAVIKSPTIPDKNNTRQYPGEQIIDYAYRGTPPGSPLRRLMVDFWARHSSDGWLRTDMNTDFLADLVRELVLLRRPQLELHPSDGSLSTCSYHQHGNDQGCYSRDDDEV